MRVREELTHDSTTVKMGESDVHEQTRRQRFRGSDHHRKVVVGGSLPPIIPQPGFDKRFRDGSDGALIERLSFLLSEPAENLSPTFYFGTVNGDVPACGCRTGPRRIRENVEVGHRKFFEKAAGVLERSPGFTGETSHHIRADGCAGSSALQFPDDF